MDSTLHAPLIGHKSSEHKRKSWNLTTTSSEMIKFKLQVIIPLLIGNQTEKKENADSKQTPNRKSKYY